MPGSNSNNAASNGQSAQALNQAHTAKVARKVAAKTDQTHMSDNPKDVKARINAHAKADRLERR